MLVDKLDKAKKNNRHYTKKILKLKLDELMRSRFVELFGDPVHNDKGWETDTVENLCKKIYGGWNSIKSYTLSSYEEGDHSCGVSC